MKVPTEVTLKSFYCFSQSVLSKSNAVICAHVLTLRWSISSFVWHSFKVLACKWKHVPSLISWIHPPLIQYPPSHPDPAISNKLTIIFKLLSMRWKGIPAGGENVIHPAGVKPGVMQRAGGGKKGIFDGTPHGNVKLSITCLSDSRF